MLKFMDVFGRWGAAAMTQLEAAESLGMCERTFRRWCRRVPVEVLGADIKHGLVGDDDLDAAPRTRRSPQTAVPV